MSKRQKLPRTGTVSKRIRQVGANRYEVNVEALMAVPMALYERREASGRMDVYTDGSEFDVMAVMAERDSLVYLTATRLADAARLAAWGQCPPEHAQNLLGLCLPALAEAELLLWHQEIWTAAVGADGSAQPFEGVPYRAEDLPGAVQYWGFNRDLTQQPEALETLGLPPGFIAQAFVLFPLPARADFRALPRDRRPFWLQALNAQGEAALLREAPSLLPLIVLNRGVAGLSAEEATALPPDDQVPRYRFFPPIAVGEAATTGPYDFLLAGLSFLQQEFVEERPLRVTDRAERRRLEAKAGTLPDVRTVAFRKAAHDSEDPAGQRGPYDCHFLVGAHWRRASPRMKEPRPVYVRPYVKGNLEKPFRPPQTTVKVVKR